MYEAKCLVMDYGAAAGGGNPTSAAHHAAQLAALAPVTAGTAPGGAASVVPSGPHIVVEQPQPRWQQYTQLWRQHQMYINGKGGGGGKDSPDKKDDSSTGELWTNVEAQAAFLGPTLWDKTLPYDTDLKYVDLDEFLSENGMPVDAATAVGSAGIVPLKEDRVSPSSSSTTLSVVPPAALGALPTAAGLVQAKREPSPCPSETVDSLDIPPSPASTHADSSTYLSLSYPSPGASFDPRTRAFSDEELKPQPLVKKSRKQQSNNAGSVQFVPDTLKDEKYWARRRKNNAAAKRSRDARRMKENQIALRAGYLEKENLGLRQEMERLKKENMVLRDRLAKFTSDI